MSRRVHSWFKGRFQARRNRRGPGTTPLKPPPLHPRPLLTSRLALAATAVIFAAACSRSPEAQLALEVGYHGAVNWVTIEDLPRPLAQFETVFWDPRDTPSLRRLLRQTDVALGREVLEIGTGTGLLALCAAHAGAARVVATDINPNAVKNARANAGRFADGERLEVRLVSPDRPGAFAVIGEREQFDVIISNPPWVNRTPQRIAEHALYDASFQLLRTLLDGLPRHLRPGGRVLLAYGCVDAIRTLHEECARRGFVVRVLDDDRQLDQLPEEFLPGMLLEVTLPAPSP